MFIVTKKIQQSCDSVVHIIQQNHDSVVKKETQKQIHNKIMIPLYILLDKIMILSEIYFWNKKRCQPLDREQ